jgi:IS5 family transposase
MYKSTLKQMTFEKFLMPFGGKLRSDNRWVKLAKLIPWHEFEEIYARSFAGTGMGAPAKSVRIALGALIIKERLGTSDEETVQQIQENPYLQYFLGFESYRDDPPFDPSMFVYFRKRLGDQSVAEINEIISLKATEETRSKTDRNDDSNPPCQDTNKGKLLVDATCAPADIGYPTDLKLLNEAREKTEEIIDTLHKPFRGHQKKPRTYCQRARKDFLSAVKRRQLSHRQLRQAIRKQLGYLQRNLKSIDELSRQSSLLLLDRREYKNLLVSNEVYCQQKWMYDQHAKRIDDRIVSSSQPHVRPIKRGKPGAVTEFGAKVSVSLIDGYSFVDRISWDNYNESGDLKAQIEQYHRRFGYWPESVHADQIYRTRENRSFCKEKGIRLSGPALGKPVSQPEMQREIKKQVYQDEIARNAIEGKFGQGKRRFSLGRVMSKLAQTSESAIWIIFLVMNLERWLKAILFWLFKKLDFRSLFERELSYNFKS